MQVSIHNSILVRSTEFSRRPPVQTPSTASENCGVTTDELLSACSPIHYHSIPCWKQPLALHSPRQSISVPYKDLYNPTASCACPCAPTPQTLCISELCLHLPCSFPPPCLHTHSPCCSKAPSFQSLLHQKENICHFQLK